MDRYEYPTGKARRVRDRESKRLSQLRAKKLEEELKAKHVSDKEINSELREANELVKAPTASPASGRRARKVARKKFRPIQAVTSKPGYDLMRPLFVERELRGSDVLPGPRVRLACHEAGTSYNPHRRLRAKQTGKNDPVRVRTFDLKPKFVIGQAGYRKTKSVKDQLQLMKGHAAHVRPGGGSLVRYGMLALLQMYKSEDGSTRIVPHRYVGKGGQPCVELFEISVFVYSDPTAVTIDRVNTPEPSPRIPETVVFEDGSEKVRYVRKTLHKSQGGYMMQTAAEFNEDLETRKELRERRAAYREAGKPYRKGKGPKRHDGDKTVPTKFIPATAKPKKLLKRKHAALRDLRRIVDFDMLFEARNKARELAKPDYSAAIAERISAHDKQVAELRAQPEDPVKVGKKAEKLAAFKRKQAIYMESVRLKKASCSIS